MPTLTATSAMRRALEKAETPAPRHAADKSPEKPGTWIFPAGASVAAPSNETAKTNTPHHTGNLWRRSPGASGGRSRRR